MMMSGILIAGDTKGQSIREVRISLTLEEASPAEALAAIEKATKFKFLYKKVIFTGHEPGISLKARNKTVADILQKIARQTGLSFHQVNNIIAVHPAVIPDSGPPGQPIAPHPPNQIITGQVTDEHGRPLPGASVLVKGFALGAVTDQDGTYTLEAPDDATMLVFSFIGYITEEVEIAGRSVIDFSMLPDIQSLQGVEVVSTGYYETEQRFNTGNIAKIDSEVIERQPVVNPLETLQGRVAGVFIQQTSGTPGAALNINIRGLNSLNNGQTIPGIGQLANGNQPFYVIDGVPFTPNSLNSSRLNLNGGNPLATLRPGDIESIEILKDADATAIYGSRGANGVILITTKEGKSGKTSFTFDFSRGIGQVANRVDLLNTDQYLIMRQEAVFNDRKTLSARDSIQLSDAFLWDPSRNTDWQEEILGGTADQTQASVTISGGSELTRFLFRANLLSQTNVYNFDDSEFRTASGHFNISHNSRDKRFSADFSTTYSINDNNQNGIPLTREIYELAPNAPTLFDELGNLNFSDNFENPLRLLEQKYDNVSRNLVTNASFSYELLEGLNVKTSLGYNNITVSEERITPISSFTLEERQSANGTSELATAIEDSWIVEPQLSYIKKVGNGTLSLLIGATFQGTQSESIDITGAGFTSDLFIRDITSAPTNLVTNNEFSEYRYTAVFARVNYNWADKYLLNLTGRRDGSSRFGPSKQFGNFGAIGTAWIFSEERFINDNIGFLSFGKLRASYGITGNDQIGNYRFLNTFAPGGNTVNYNNNLGLLPVRAANTDFSWESNKKLEFGLELGFIGDRIRLNTSWFSNRSEDQLIDQRLSFVSGFQTVQTNLPAIIENRGIEIELNTINVRTNNFTWSSSLNLTRARNELLEFPDIESFPEYNNFFEVGRSLFGGRQFRSLGVNPETGVYVTDDINGDGRVGLEDRQNFVEISQDYFGGFNNTFVWKGFQLNIFFRFVKQNAPSFNSAFSRTPGFTSDNQPVNVLDRWQNPGDVTGIQRFTTNSTPAFAFERHYDGVTVDASFIRLQNVSLSWIIPSEWMRQVQIQQARLYVQGQNLLTITPYEGIDPESQGLNLPPLRMITSGIQLTF